MARGMWLLVLLVGAGVAVLTATGCSVFGSLSPATLELALAGQSEPYVLVNGRDFRITWAVRNRNGDLLSGYEEDDIALATSNNDIAAIRSSVAGPVLRTRSAGTCTVTGIITGHGISDSFEVTVQP